MRPVERIPIFLKHVNWYILIKDIWGNLDEDETLDVYNSITKNLDDVKEFWIDNPDLRISQVLVNLGIIPNSSGMWYYMEESEILEKLGIPEREYMIWGTRGKDGKSPLEFKPIKDLSTDHIEAILETQTQISYYTRTVFEDELKRRKNE